MSLPKKDRVYTYSDYLSWPENERIEIIAGKAYMQAAPSRIHQKVLSEVHRQIANYLLDKDCEVYPAPFHVVLDPAGDHENEADKEYILEPDISIICNKNKLNERGCQGSPDLIVEIISPSTARKDKMEKFNIYEQAGVKEYWIIEPEEKMISVFTLENNRRFGRPDLYGEEDKVTVSIFDDLLIDLKTVFTV
ncbi:Uma2 family endonuclease [Lentibacillus sp. N15]|uniref:Uma2 family endonuclease n=1 Tax=Lentibacillus songyuanensis TaxID=3136161 RepID=UPI0031BA7B76